MQYHDTEWGRPSRDDKHLFEMLILETMQAGLSWYTILKKRENFRKAFDQFDAEKISRYGDEKFARLMEDPGIIRNKQKISAAINNAARYLEVREVFGGFDKYIWQFTDGKTIDNRLKGMEDYPVTSRGSDAMSRDMKLRGFKFVGSTTCYAYMQSIGMVNDHLVDCWVRTDMK
jgi:DNA-3-methyladenine glycosylase I